MRREGRVTVAASDDDLRRLVAVVDRQRSELDRFHALAAGESVVAMARGALMERLGFVLSPEAAGQLAELSAATGIPPAEMAASVLSGSLSDSGPRPPRCHATAWQRRRSCPRLRRRGARQTALFAR